MLCADSSVWSVIGNEEGIRPKFWEGLYQKGDTPGENPLVNGAFFHGTEPALLVHRR